MSGVSISSRSLSENFTQIHNDTINNAKLGMDTRLLLIWLISKPATWELNTKSIATIHNVGKNRVTKMSKELQEHGYLKLQRWRDGGLTWFISETPITDWSSRIEEFEASNPNESGASDPHPRFGDKANCTKNDPHPRNPDMGNPDMAFGDALVISNISNTDHLNNNTTILENREPQSWESKQQLEHNWQPSKEIIEALLFSYQSDGMTADHIEIKRFDFIDWWNKPSNRQTQSADGAFRRFVAQGWIKYDKKNYLQSKAAELSVERQQVYLDSAKQKTGKFDPIDSLSNGFDRMIKKQDGRRATKTVTTIEALTDRSWAEGLYQ